MVRIRITAGVFGWNRGQSYDLVKAGDPPIEVDEALAQRLVTKGVAEYVTPSTQPDEEPAAEPTAEPDEEPAGKAYHIGMTAKELREIGESYGLTFKQGMSKADMVAKMDELFAGLEPAEAEQDAEGAPTFDAAEAVQ